MSKRTSWIFLILLFIFDDLLSYYAITQKTGREANLLVAPVVEEYPFLYFLLIPTTVLIMYLIVKILSKIAQIILKNKELTSEEIERIVLASAVVFWVIGNSSINLAYVLGYKQPVESWYKTMLFGVIMSLCYFFFRVKSKIDNLSSNRLQ